MSKTMNIDLRRDMFEAEVKHWEVALALGITESSFSRLLRRELPDEEKNKIRQAIKRVKAER